MLKKYKPNGEIEFRPVYLNSTTKTVKNSLKHTFQEILYEIDNWINEESGWIAEFIESQYINISTYRTIIRKFLHKITCSIKKFKKRSNQHPK